MKYSFVNNTEIFASKLVLGTALFGTEISTVDSFKLLDKFCELGGNIIDTASVYANWNSKEKSLSEKTIGKWLLRSNLREKLYIATKGGHFDLLTNESRLNYSCVREDLEQSFDNLKTDYIDIYYLHKDDINRSPIELIEMFNEAIKGFNVKYLGVSNWSYDRINQANKYALEHGLKTIVASQIQHNIAKVNCSGDDIFCMTENEYEKYCDDDISVFAFSSQAKGFFAILNNSGIEAIPQSIKNEFLNDYNLALFDRLKTVAKEKNVSVLPLVLTALLSDERVNTFSQIGPVNTDQMVTSFMATDIVLTESEINFIYDKK